MYSRSWRSGSRILFRAGAEPGIRKSFFNVLPFFNEVSGVSWSARRLARSPPLTPEAELPRRAAGWLTKCPA